MVVESDEEQGSVCKEVVVVWYVEQSEVLVGVTGRSNAMIVDECLRSRRFFGAYTFGARAYPSLFLVAINQ